MRFRIKVQSIEETELMKRLMMLIAAGSLLVSSPAVANGGQRSAAPVPARVQVFEAPG